MKKLTTTLLGLALLFPALASAADFEGVVALSITGAQDRVMPMTFSIKPGFTRIDMNAAGGRFGGMIMDQKKQEITILMPQQRMYMTQPIPQQAVDQANQTVEQADVQQTNDHEKILGYDTTKYVAKSKDGTTEIWVTDQLGTFLGLGPNRPMGPMGHARPSGGAAGHAWEKAFKGKEAFPLRVITTDASGNQTFKLEATDVQKKQLPDSLFQVPSDFKDIGAMMRGMGGMPGMPGPKRGSDGE